MDGDSDGQRRRGHVWLIVNEKAPADAPPKLFKCEQATKETRMAACARASRRRSSRAMSELVAKGHM